ncbi:phenylalanine--tRNA ligase subunit beta [Candidatus Dojkabacteria bacterium]|nr:phenylalanine--tRNA ligase subunit beta [Candidatus Dojkabacteria bacterium]
MLISLNWLKQYLPELYEEPETIATKLSESLAEVESIKYVGRGLENLFIGQVKKIGKHPKSEKLTLCTVNDGEKDRKIVCGAPNVSEGIKVVVVRPEGVVFNASEKLNSQSLFQITEREVAGVKSQGMICSMKELGIAEDHEGIWILPENSIVGQNFTDLIKDAIFEIENKALTHRPDCFSHEGIARELSAIFKTPFKTVDAKTPLFPTQKVDLKIELRNQELCPRFSAIVITNVKIQPSPIWMQLRLMSIGIRPINNIVDATNYFMIDMGQPMHAFDYEKIEKKKLIIRNADDKEKIKTLDGVERKLTREIIVVSDPIKVLSIAGVIGGESSEISEKTKTIVLESANWEMFNNRRTARSLGIRTEAGTRFEKGQDPSNTQESLERAIHLISDIAGGEIASEFIDIYENPVEKRKIVFDLNAVKKILGIDVSKEEILDILKHLGIEVVGAEKLPTKLLTHSEGNKVELTIPTFRRDLNITEDIVEEIARIYGYEKIQPTFPARSIGAAKKNVLREFIIKVKRTLSALGLDEIYTYSFIGEGDYKNVNITTKGLIKIQNPLAPELSYVRNSISPSHLAKLEMNLKNFEEVNIFEISRVALRDKRKDGLPEQPIMMNMTFAERGKNEKIYMKAKGVVDELLEILNVNDLKFVNIKNTTNNNPLWHPARSAKIWSGETEIAMIGEVHPSVISNLGLNGSVCIVEFAIEDLMKVSKKDASYTPIPGLQKIVRDLTVWVAREVEVQEMLEAISENRDKLISKIFIKDIFEGNTNSKTKKNNRKSVTFTIEIQPFNKALLDEESNKIVKQIFDILEKKFRAK